MSFVSYEFMIFFAVVVPIYFALPLRWRWVLLLLASYFFYSVAETSYIVLIAFSTLVDYFAARGIASTPEENTAKRRALLALSIAVNLGTLFIFKYFNFFSESANGIFATLGVDYIPITHKMILPVGISFYTFQSMSYTIDVFRGSIPAERNAGIFATYVAFFPQLVAGPIERAGNMLPQFKQHFTFDYDRVVSGLRLVLWGAFKKIVIADRLAIYVNEVYNNLNQYQGVTLWVATIFFAIQIYCDFSGYSDIAIGAARVMGFDLMENFRQPYLSRSIREFWRRWHISLSTWFRDYLYIPLGGNRVSFGRNLINLMIVFVVSGLWHGANWTFVVWGALHGLYIVVETVYHQWDGRPKLPDTLFVIWIQRGWTFALVLFAWIFFRANNIGDAGYVIKNMLNFNAYQLTTPFETAFLETRLEFSLAIGLIILLFLVDFAQSKTKLDMFSMLRWKSIRWAAYYVIAATVFLSWILYAATAPSFIYFQF